MINVWHKHGVALIKGPSFHALLVSNDALKADACPGHISATIYRICVVCELVFSMNYYEIYINIPTYAGNTIELCTFV